MAEKSETQTGAAVAEKVDDKNNDKNIDESNGSAQSPASVIVGKSITVRDLATLIDRSPIDLIRILMQYGIMAPITHSIDHDTAVILGEELGVAIEWPAPVISEDEEQEEEEVEESSDTVSLVAKSAIQTVLENEKEENLVERPPVVAVLGHVDHGKTTLLDQIRKSDVVSGEAGGITQRTGAYQTTIHGQKITFLDTPGHEAFTAMRARGAQVTDIVVLVVAADDGVMPQTREAINHAKAAGVQIVVAMNKIDRPNANPQRVLEELAQQGLQSEEWGGETIVVPVSALDGTGVNDLLENILLVAELEQYRANPNGRMIGTVIEAEVDKSRGVTATLLVQNGTLNKGDTLVVGTTSGRIKAMFDPDGTPITKAGPSSPVVILGLSEAPSAGDVFDRVRSDKIARRIASGRKLDADALAHTPVDRHISLEDLFARIEGGVTETLNVIVRADMQGTLEPVVNSLQELGNDEIGIKVLQAAIGDISESDIMLAEASDAIVIGFSVNVDKAAQLRAEASGVEVRRYEIIYKLIEDIEDAITGMLEPIFENVVIGHAEILKLFKLRRGVIAGCRVSDGLIKRNAMARALRGSEVVVPDTKIDTLRRFEDDVAEVRSGFECGIKLASNSTDLQEGDIIEVFEKQQTR